LEQESGAPALPAAALRSRRSATRLTWRDDGVEVVVAQQLDELELGLLDLLKPVCPSPHTDPNVTAMIVRGLIERDAESRLALTEQGRAALTALDHLAGDLTVPSAHREAPVFSARNQFAIRNASKLAKSPADNRIVHVHVGGPLEIISSLDGMG
jgi:hypothetical protein